MFYLKKKLYLEKCSMFSKFYDILTKKKLEIFNKYSEVFYKIDNILMGDFCGAKERKKYFKGFYYLSYLLTVKYFIDNTITFCYLLFRN